MTRDRQRPYRPIDDWSVTGRAKLVDAHRAEIALLLDDAFTSFLDQTSVTLGGFGFRSTDDPVREAVEWCIERFAHGDLNPELVQPDCRSFRLFTQPGFWLSQKVGKRAYEARRKEQRLRAVHQQQALAAHEPSTFREGEVALRALQTDTVGALSRLHAATCADMVTFWLLGTEKLRALWFDWATDTTLVVAPSASQLSKHIADALFRFLVIFWGMLTHGAPSVSVRIVHASCFTPCNNAAPYWHDPRVVAPPLGVTSPSDAKRLRKDGVVELLRACVECARDPGRDGDVTEHVRANFTRSMLRRSLKDLYRLGLAGDALFAQLDESPEETAP